MTRLIRISALKMLILSTVGLQIRPNDRTTVRPNDRTTRLIRISALKMLILKTVGLQIRPNDRTQATEKRGGSHYLVSENFRLRPKSRVVVG